MADRDRDRQQPHQLQVHRQIEPQKYGIGGVQTTGGGPSASKVIAVVTLLPVGGTLLFLAGLTLIGSIIGLVLATPIFIICSPVLVPATIAIGLAVTGFLGSGAMSLTGLTSLSWVFNYIRGANVPAQIDSAKRHLQDAAGQKTKEAGQAIQSRAQEGGDLQKRT